jgi:hypothetical protein
MLSQARLDGSKKKRRWLDAAADITASASAVAPTPELDPLDELSRLVSEDPGRGYRIQFRSRAHDLPGRRERLDFGWSIMTGARSSDQSKATQHPVRAGVQLLGGWATRVHHGRSRSSLLARRSSSMTE